MEISQIAEGIIRLALAEDLGSEGDITTRACCPSGERAGARLIAREECTVAGQTIAAKVFELAGYDGVYDTIVEDGRVAGPGTVIARIEGDLAGVLAAERTAINFMSHLSGIATLTSRFVSVASPFGVEILDTRKTMPGMRALEKFAVHAGGGTNHRQGLFDGILIKDNHIAAAGGIEIAVRKAKSFSGGKFAVEVEASDLLEVTQALDSGADIIMLDNMEVPRVKEALELIDGRARVEVSGGVNEENVESYARTGVDFISIGFLTHSAPAIDMSLEFDRDDG